MIRKFVLLIPLIMLVSFWNLASATGDSSFYNIESAVTISTSNSENTASERSNARALTNTVDIVIGQIDATSTHEFASDLEPLCAEKANEPTKMSECLVTTTCGETTAPEVTTVMEEANANATLRADAYPNGVSVRKTPTIIHELQIIDHPVRIAVQDLANRRFADNDGAWQPIKTIYREAGGGEVKCNGTVPWGAN